MNITGIITEYNPLHNGHVYHINESKKLTKCDGLICVMSGNFVQRGNPALIDKWSRAEIALNNGVDLVIELPVIYSLSSAEFFSFGSVSLLNSLGIVDNLCFGSESGDIDTIMQIADILVEEPDDFKFKLKSYLDQGNSYPTARSKALSSFWRNDPYIVELLSSSNNILGIEYCKSLIKLNSSIKPYTIQRKGSTYNSTSLESNFCSATSIRKHLKEEESNINLLQEKVPFNSFNTLKDMHNKDSLTFENAILNFLKFKILTNENKLENLPDVSEGLHNKIYKALHESCTYEELISKIKSKRYTETRINRILCQYFVGFDNYNTKVMRTHPAPYARILGFNERGREILKKLKTHSSIPIYGKLPKILNTTLELDIQATKAYSLINKSVSPNSDYLISPITLLK